MPYVHFQSLYDHYPEIIGMMPDRFTSHEFINRLFQKHQGDFIEALYAYRDSDAPMRSVTSQLAKQLHQFDEVAHDGEQTSPDIFGDRSECAVWKKR